MHFTALPMASLALALALAQVGSVVASPAARAQCAAQCVNDAECVDCLGTTCVSLGTPGTTGACL
ncbi:hypothetical protein VTO73DRAFT_12033 [Trametes versicolor]